MAKTKLAVVPNDDSIQAALDSTLNKIKDQFGNDSIMRLGSSEIVAVDVIPTGSIALDLALGVRGIPRGRVSEIYGQEAAGKTSLCQHIIANAQAAGLQAAFIDAEHALDASYAKACGVDIENLIISQPNNGEEALEITDLLIRSGVMGCVVVDSVAALVPKAELDGEMSDNSIGLQARLMSKALRKLIGSVQKYNTALIFTNQLREKIGGYGNPLVTPGGRSLKYFSSVRLEMSRIETLKQGTESVGSKIRVKVAKNKVAAPFRVAEFDIDFGEGISKEGNLVDVGTQLGVLSKSGTWFLYKDERLGQGREKAKRYLRENPDKADEIEKQIISRSDNFVVPVEGIEEVE